MSDAVKQAAMLRRSGQAGAAEELLRKHLRRSPGDAQAHRVLALCLCDQAKLDQAIFHAQRAVDIDPTSADAPVTLGNAHTLASDFPRALAAYRAALARRPDHPNAAMGLGGLLIESGRFDEAEQAMSGPLAANPDHIALSRVFARALEGAGRIEDALAQQRLILARAPEDARTLASHCFMLQASDSQSPEQIADAHRRYGRVVTKRAAAIAPSLGWRTPRATGADRPLRIGYVSPDFREHSVAWFIEPILRSHDRTAFQPLCFHTGSTSDEVTARIGTVAELHAVPCASGGVEIPSPAEAALARRIVEAKVDVLVDLSGHTGGSVLGAFALQPAPLQLTYLGYPDTTGLPQIHGRIVDGITDPPTPEVEARASERLIRLPRCFLCYRPRQEAPDPAPPPVLADPSGIVTFGSFNNIKKLSPACLKLWARVLQALPASRLLIKGKFVSEVTRARFQDALATHGVSTDRVGFLPFTDSAREHLELYSRIDIALDSFPYHGTTTTCEALWQGVPVVTLAGDRHASRVGASLLACAGLPELVATDADEFVRIAVALAQDQDRLRTLRTTMRDRLRASPLLDDAGFTRILESAIRTLWRERCVS